jgi:hypothetical protein
MVSGLLPGYHLFLGPDPGGQVNARLAHDDVKQRIAGLTASAKSAHLTDNGMAAFVQTLSPEQLSETLMAIAQQLAR